MAYRFDPVGACIYCKKSNGPLGDEHIIPYGLAGQLILPKSSCKSCGAITGAFEGTVLRTIFGDFRMRHKLPTRRKLERPKFRTIGIISSEGRTSQKQVPVEDFPAPFWVYTFGQCGFFLGANPDTDVSLGSMKSIHDNNALNDFKREHSWDGMLTMKYMPYEFMRMLAKIGHSYACATIGPNNFRPLALRSILTKEANVSYLVGMNEQQEPIAKSQLLHEVKITIQGRLIGTTLLIAYIRLFPDAETPTYHVVVGDFAKTEQELAAIERISHQRDFSVERSTGRVIPENPAGNSS